MEALRRRRREPTSARLAKQNPSLKTDDWRLIHKEAKDTGQLLVLGIGLASLKPLKELESKPYLELSRVNFILPGSKSGQHQENKIHDGACKS